MAKKFTVVIEKGKDGWYFAEVPELQGCHTQAKTKKQLMSRIKEAIELCMEDPKMKKREVSVTQVAVPA